MKNSASGPNRIESPTPMDLTMPSAFLAMPRGSRLYGWPSGGRGFSRSCGTSGSDGVQSGFPRSDPNGFFDVGDEDFSIADPPGLSGTTDRLDGFLDHVVT